MSDNILEYDICATAGNHIATLSFADEGLDGDYEGLDDTPLLRLDVRLADDEDGESIFSTVTCIDARTDEETLGRIVSIVALFAEYHDDSLKSLIDAFHIIDAGWNGRHPRYETPPSVISFLEREALISENKPKIVRRKPNFV